MLSEGCHLLAKISDLLSHTHFTERMLIMPDRASVPRTANPAASPPNSNRYDVMSRCSPSSGLPHVSSISSSAVAITQLWYPTPSKTDPYVATIRYFGSVVVKLRPLPQPQLRAHIHAETNPSAQRATQLRSVLARVCSVSRQNLNTTTVP
jgi:hypothetical protein